MLVVSDLVEPTDIVKSGSFLGLLDIIPKSNLQNTDYIQDRNVLSHTISNPQVVKSITIKITNPDLTNIELEPNSAFLLAITLPQPKQTVLLASLENNAQEQAVASSLQNTTAQQIKQGALPTLPTFQQYNTTGEPAPNTHTEHEDKRTASRRRIDIAKQASALNKLKSEEEKNAFLERLPESDRREVAETADRMRILSEQREGRAGGGARPPTREETERQERTRFGKVLTPEERASVARKTREILAGGGARREGRALLPAEATEGSLVAQELRRRQERKAREEQTKPPPKKED